MFDQLMQSFTQSSQGQRAFAQLQGQGYTPQQASGMLSAALPAAARAMQGSMGSMLGGGAAGMMGALGGGAQPQAGGLGMMPGMGGAQAPQQAGGGNPLSGLMAMIPGMGGAQAPQQGGAPGGDPSVLSQLAHVNNSGYAVNFLSAAVSGMVRGQGMKNSAIDGLQGVVGGHVAEVIAGQFGLPKRVAGVAGAVITPLMVDFLWEKFQGGGLQSMFGGGGAQQGGDPSQQLGQGQQGGGSTGFGAGMFGSGPATAPGIGAGIFGNGPAASPGIGAGLFGGGGGGGYTPPRFSGWGRQGG